MTTIAIQQVHLVMETTPMVMVDMAQEDAEEVGGITSNVTGTHNNNRIRTRVPERTTLRAHQVLAMKIPVKNQYQRLSQ